MARRKDHTPVQLTQLTIDTVIEFIQHRSISQLSLRSLAKLIGYSPGTLINLFNSYNYLLLAVSGYTLGQINQQITADLDGLYNSSAQDKLLTIAKSYLQFASEHPGQWRQVFEHRLEDNQIINSEHQQKIDGLFAKVEPLLLALAPNADSNELVRCCRTLWASVHGICIISVEDKLFAPSQISSESLIESLINHYLTNWISHHR